MMICDDLWILMGSECIINLDLCVGFMAVLDSDEQCFCGSFSGFACWIYRRLIMDYIIILFFGFEDNPVMISDDLQL